jgi:DNA-binding beta-propeller fold protein YncE
MSLFSNLQLSLRASVSDLTIKRAAMVVAVFGAVGIIAACNKDDVAVTITEEATPVSLSLTKIGGYDGAAVGAAEITAYDAASRRLFVVNGANGTVDVLDLSNPSLPVRVGGISAAALGGGINSVAVNDGLVALAIEATVKTSPGVVAFYNASDLRFLHSVAVGALPDMVVFTPDGRTLLVANEGEPNSYNAATSVDPEGSISVITVNRTGISTVATADFRSFNGQEALLRSQGIRIFGPNASAAQDLEPEYIAVSDDGRTAYVTLQENNAIAIVDVATARVTSLKPLGFKDHNLAGFGMDASDEDGSVNTNTGVPAIKIGTLPVKGMYMPDAISFFRVNNTNYLITANEGDARADWPGFNEETRVRAHCTAGLDPTVFADAANLILDSNLGRLRITANPNGNSTGKNAAGQCNELFSFGARSFSIWNTDIQRVYDSGDDFERRTTALPNALFNTSNDSNTLDGRSAAKGPEPEGVTVGKFGNKTFAFVGLERVGGVMVYDISNPTAATFVTYLNTRTGATGDRGVEGLTFISAKQSPNGKPLLITGNETSGTTAIYQIDLSY